MVTFNGWMVRRAGVPANGRYLMPDDRVVRPFVSGMRSCRPTAVGRGDLPNAWSAGTEERRR